MPLSLSTTPQTFLSDIILSAECPQLKWLPPPKSLSWSLSFEPMWLDLGHLPCICPSSQHSAQFLLAFVAFHSSSWRLSGCWGTRDTCGSKMLFPRTRFHLGVTSPCLPPLSLTQNDLQLSASFTILKRTSEELLPSCLEISFFVFVIVISHPRSTNSP